MEKSTRTGLIVFCFSLLFLACTIRSGVLVDMSFLPRFFLLSLILPVFLLTAARRSFFIRHSSFEIAFILFYLWSLASAFWAIDPAETFVQSQLIFLSLLLFLIIFSVMKSYPGFELLFIKACLPVLLLSYGLAFYKMSKLQFYNPYSILSVSANNNLYSGFLIIALPLAFCGFIKLRGIWKYLSAIAGVFALFFIIILQSRAAYLGILAALFISFGFLLLRYRKVFSLRNIFTGSVFLVLLVTGIFIFTKRLDETRRQYFIGKISIWNYFTSYEELQGKKIRELTSANPDDHSKMAPFDYSENYYSNANFRVIFWQKSLGLIRTHPFSGVGCGNWRLAIPSEKDPPNPEHTVMNFTYSEPHNEWIRILSEAGIPGFIPAVFLFIPPLIVLWRVLFSVVKPPVETLIYASFILGLYLFACFDFPLRRIEHNVMLWSVFAFMMHKTP